MSHFSILGKTDKTNGMPRIAGALKERYYLEPRGKTYNLTVDVGHTFYVGELKTWVHNTGPCGDEGRPVDARGGGKGEGQTLREIQVSSGGKGAWSKAINKPEPSTIYTVDGNKTYQTDQLGRVERVESILSYAKRGRNTYQQCRTGKCGVAGDEGGHLIASVFNGPGERLNLPPMNGNLNKGAWKAMENIWAIALKDGKTVRVKIEPIYSGTSLRPERFNVKYSLDGGRPINVDFKNSPRTKN